MNLKANKISHRKELVNLLNTLKNHKSLQRFNLANCHSYSTLNFSEVTEREVIFQEGNKNGHIPAKILKKSIDISIKEITFVINDCIENGIFHDDLKFADLSPIF